MIAARHCSKPGCSNASVATLTYNYADSTVVLGPLATVAEPNAYDLCETHAEHLIAPRGWQIVRLATNFEPAPPSGDDLLALVDAVRQAATVTAPSQTPPRRALQGEHESSSTRVRSTDAITGPQAQTRRAQPQDSPVSYGPFTSSSRHNDADSSVFAPRNGDETTSNTPMKQPDTSSPLDPQSPYAKRRAQFTVVSNDDASRDNSDINKGGR